MPIVSINSHPDARLSTAVVLPGSNLANHVKLFDRMKAVLRQTPHVYVVSVSSKDISNIKSLMSYIVKHLTEGDNISSNGSVEDEDDESASYDKRLRYDFDILVNWCNSIVKKDSTVNSIFDLRLVVSIDDAHSFDVPNLSALIGQMQSYVSEIPFKLILSVATSIDVFQENLKRSCIRLLKGVSINAQLTGSLEEVIMDTLLESNSYNDVLIGPHTFQNIIRRQRESLESIESYVSSLKYTYMTYFYSNPFAIIPSLLLEVKGNFRSLEEKASTYFTEHHYKAIRLLPSFTVYINKMANELKTSKDEARCEELRKLIRQLFEDDKVLLKHIINAIYKFLIYKNQTLYGIMILEALQGYCYHPSGLEYQPISRLELYSLAFKGILNNDRNAEFSQIPEFSKKGANIISYLSTNLPKSTSLHSLSELLRLTDRDRDSDVWPCSIETPKVFVDFNKLVTKKYSEQLSKFLHLDREHGMFSVKYDEGFHGRNEYFESREGKTEFVSLFRQICDYFFGMLKETVFPKIPRFNPNAAVPRVKIPPGYKSLFLHEIFVVDKPSLHENVFAPTFRSAIEMALSNPQHYWGNIGREFAYQEQIKRYAQYCKENNIEITAKAEDSNGKKRKILPQETEDLEEIDVEKAQNEWSTSSMAYDPHICILYALYRESSLYINIYDYYRAFMSVVQQPQDQGKNNYEFQRKALAWFLQGIAELKFLGIIRDSKRKFECVEKLAWRGL